jgi:hypothetical protein
LVKILFRQTSLLRKVLRSIVVYMCAGLSAFAQQPESVNDLYKELDSLFAEESIPDLFKLADSLLALDSAKIHALSLRTGYVSRIVTSGRTFGFNQFGLTPGATYYHPKGVLAGVSGYWSSEFSPKYYLTDITIGYTKQIRKRFVGNVAHHFYLYNDSLTSHSFNKSAEASLYHQSKYADAGIEYTYLYGGETSHRLTANINGRYKIRTNGIVSAVTLMPGASLQWGNANVFYLRQPRTGASELYQLIKQNKYPRLTIREITRLTYFLETNRETAARFLLRNNDYTDGQASTLIDTYYEGQVQQKNVFGFMNYCFSFPVMLSAGNFSLLVNYTYNVPVALPGEDFVYEPNGYFSTSLSYMMQWTR